jgi:integrase
MLPGELPDVASRRSIPEPFRTAVFLDGTSGLRVGELLGLKWEDVDFKQKVIHIRRSIVKQKIGPPKTEASQKPFRHTFDDSER